MFLAGGCEDGRSPRRVVGVKFDIKEFLCLLILRVEILAVVLEDERGPQFWELPVDRCHADLPAISQLSRAKFGKWARSWSSTDAL